MKTLKISPLIFRLSEILRRRASVGAVGLVILLSGIVSGAVVPGDFEVLLEGTLVRVNVSTALKGGLSYSGQVVAGGSSSLISGTFGVVQGGSWSATQAATGVSGPIGLRYSKDSSGVETLLVSAGSSGAAVPALKALRSAGPTQNLGRFTLAFKYDEAVNTQQSIQTRILQAEADLQNKERQKVAAADLEMARVAKESAEKAFESKRSELGEKQKKYAAYFQAKNAAVTNLDEKNALLEEGLTDSVAGIALALSEDAAVAAYAEEVGTSLEEVAATAVQGLRLHIEGVLYGEIDTTLAVVRDTLAKLRSGFSTQLEDPSDDSKPDVFLSDDGQTSVWGQEATALFDAIQFDLEALLPLDLQSKVSKAAEIFRKVEPALSSVVTLVNNAHVADGQLEAFADPEKWSKDNGKDFSRQEFSSIETLESGMIGAEDLVKSMQDVYAGLLQTNAVVDAELASIRSLKLVLERSLLLLSYRGYGVASVAFQAAPVTGRLEAVLRGTAPDGQAWSAIAAVRVGDDESQGKVYLSVRTGAVGSPAGLPLEAVLNVSIPKADSGTDPASFARADDSFFWWAGMPVELKGPAPQAAANPGMSVFGGMSTSRIHVRVGGSASDQGSGAFGVAVSKTNAATSLLGSKSTLTLTAPSRFNGTFVAAGTVAGRSFSGTLVSGSGKVEGFGAMVEATKKKSEPVVLGEAEAGPGENPPTISLPGEVFSWKGLKKSALAVQLDVPGELSRTSVELYRAGADGGVTGAVLAKGEVDEDGLVVLSTMSVVSGSYRIKAVREFVSGALDPVFSSAFAITQKSVPATTFQFLLGYGEGFTGAGQTDGNPYRARITVTTTALGRYSGKVDLIDLKRVNDESGEPVSFTPNAGDYIAQGTFAVTVPSLLSYPISGDLTPSDGKPDGLEASLSIPLPGGGGAHALQLSLDGVRGVPLVDEAMVDEAMVDGDVNELAAEMSLAGAGGTVLVGRGYDASKGVSKAAGTYSTAGTGYAWRRLADSHSWTYRSGSAVTYVWKSWLGTATVAATMARDGSMCFLIPPKAAAAGQFQYKRENSEGPAGGGSNAASTSNLTRSFYGFLNAKLQPNEGSRSFNAKTKTFEEGTYYTVVCDEPFVVNGSRLEVVSGRVSSVRYNTGWSNPVDPLAVPPGAFAYAERLFDAYQWKNYKTEEKAGSGPVYDLEILVDGGTQPPTEAVLPVQLGILPAASAGPASPVTVSRALTMAAATGAFTGSVKVGTVTYAISGAHVVDEESGVIARGSTVSGKLVWSLKKK